MLRLSAARPGIIFLFLSSAIAFAQQKTPAPPEFVSWLPVTDAERAMTAPVVDKAAGAEVLQWRVHVVDELLSNRDLQRVFYHYIRLKVFDEKGKEKASSVDLDYREPGGILDVAARTIRPDGSIIELDRKSVYKRDLVREGRSREKAVSFAMPGVEPGAILEYRWKQTENDNRFRYLRLHFQRDFPVQRVTYFVKPLSSAYVASEQLALLRFNSNPSPIKQENDGYNSVTVENVPAVRREPLAPSDANTQQWALLFYRQGSIKKPEQYWEEEGRKAYREFKEAVKGSEELKNAAAAVASAKSDEEKIAALITYVRKNVRSLNDPEVTDAEREKFFEKLPKDRARTATEILKSGLGTSREMNVVFAAAAMEAGFETRAALAADRQEYYFNPKMADTYFLDNFDVAVKAGGDWKVVNAGNKLLTPGLLPREQQGMSALITDAKSPMFVELPVSPPEASTERRTARLELSLTGSLAGDVEESYSGYRGEEFRNQIIRQSPAQREEWFRKRVVRMFPDADVTGIKLENVEDAAKPVVARYHLEAPQYAQVTGKRILFQPSPFRRAQASPFSAAERRFAIEFPFAWKEIDQIRLRMPKGFVFDNAESPGGMNFGPTGAYDLRLIVDKDELVTSRELTFGDHQVIFFQAKDYAAVKKAFDQVQVRDANTIALKAN